MCGIVGYIGDKKGYDIVINGLRRLEYRGYDSAGICLVNDSLELFKTKGKVADLEKIVADSAKNANTAIGHTRWATHGVPNDVNAHPHFSNNKEIVLVHNGIIENYDSIKTFLKNKGYEFFSDTDTEVLVNLIEYFHTYTNANLKEAVRLALNEVKGAYAIAVVHQDAPKEMVVARLGSPLVIGMGDNEYFVASDASPFVEFTKEAIYLEENHLATVSVENGVQIHDITSDSNVDISISEVQFSLEEIEKGGYDHFMLKEIFEQPKSIFDTLRGRLLVEERDIKMAGIWDNREKFINAKRIVIIGCGTSWHAGLIGEYLFESIARIPVEVEYASEFRYRDPIITEGDIVIAISQSGETADTLAALKMSKEKGAFIFGICNVVGSSIARITDAGAYTHAGPEIGVASTKAFTAQVAVLSLLALKLAKHRGAITESNLYKLSLALEQVPDMVQKVLDQDAEIKKIAEVYKDAANFLFLGRGFNFPVALEGALKLKEISYIHAEGYPAAEMKHGPIALIDENMPVVVIATKKGHYDKVVSNVQEIKSRKGKIIAIVTEGDEEVKALADYTIEIPMVEEAISPIVATIPLQLLSYHIAVMRGANVDQPRNLAKSVTVE